MMPKNCRCGSQSQGPELHGQDHKKFVLEADTWPRGIHHC